VVENVDSLQQVPTNLRNTVLAKAMYVLAAHQQFDQATRAAEMLITQSNTSESHYDAACGYALCARAAPALETKEKYMKRAMELLRAAIQSGFANVGLLKRDTDLDALRGREDFQSLLADLEEKVQKKHP
jgi:hypothetical protein